jgi:hypothetical protein
MTGSGKSLKERAYQELKEFLVMTIYLWVVLGILIVYKSVILAQYHIDVVQHGLALLNALALAKVMLIAKGLHLGDRYNEEPLVYTILVKAALFTIVLTCFKILEEYAIGLYHHKTFQESIADLAGGTGKGMLTLTALLFVILVPFVAYGELKRVMGEEAVADLMFHRHTVKGVQSTQAPS